MATRQLKKSEWEAFFNAVSGSLAGQTVEIEVASLAIGDQVAATHVPLLGLTYDPKDDLLEVITSQVDHMIRRPKEIHVAEDAGGLSSVEVRDGDGNQQIIKLTRPLALPAA